MIRRADPDPSPSIDADCDGPRQVLGPAAEAPRAGAVVAERGDGLAVRRELLHAAERGFRSVDVSVRVHGHEIRAAGLVGEFLLAIELAGPGAVFTPLEQELTLRTEPLHAPIDLI